MILEILLREGDVFLHFFFKDGLRVNANACIKVMDTFITPLMEDIADHWNYLFHQDAAPAHNANKTESWLTESLKGFWPNYILPHSLHN